MSIRIRNNVLLLLLATLTWGLVAWVLQAQRARHLSKEQEVDSTLLAHMQLNMRLSDAADRACTHMIYRDISLVKSYFSTSPLRPCWRVFLFFSAVERITRPACADEYPPSRQASRCRRTCRKSVQIRHANFIDIYLYIFDPYLLTLEIYLYILQV